MSCTVEYNQFPFLIKNNMPHCFKGIFSHFCIKSKKSGRAVVPQSKAWRRFVSFLSFMSTVITTPKVEPAERAYKLSVCSLLTVQRKERRQNSSNWNLAETSLLLSFLVLLTDALLPCVFPLVLSVAMRWVEDPARQWNGLRRQLLLGNAALSQVGLGGHGWRLRPAVRNVMRAVGGSVVMRRHSVGVAVHPEVGVSVRVLVCVQMGSRAAVMERPDRVHGVDFRTTVVNVQVGGGQVLLGGRPQVTGKRLQGIIPNRTRIGILTSKVALA